jgi:hypothetical protein
VHDDGGLAAERFEDDHRERLVGERRNDTGEAVEVERSESALWQRAEEAHARIVRRAPAESLFLCARAGDQEVGVGDLFPGVEQRLHALRRLEAADEEEVRRRVRPRTGRLPSASARSVK